MRTLGKTISYTGMAIILGCILIVLWSLVPIEGNYTFKVVNAGSMEPTLSRGSLIMIKPKNVYTAGDIITYENGRTAENIPVYVTHRVVDARITEGTYEYVTKGDANIFADMETIQHEYVRGRVIAHVPGIENISNFARTPGGFFLLIAMPAFAVGVEEWHRRKRNKGQPKQS